MTESSVSPADFWADADVIHTYTRAQAIADGVLVDVTDVASEAGFKVPVAITAAVHAEVNAIEGGWDAAGRLWDVVWMAMLAGRKTAGDRAEFDVRLRPNTRRLIVHIGPGDHAEPVATIGFPADF